MARSRTRQMEVDLWPGFVDALSCMLLVLIFLLSLFAMVQTTSGKFMMAEELQTGAVSSSPSDELLAAQGQIAEQKLALARLQQDASRTPAALAVAPARAVTPASVAETTAELERARAALAKVETERETYRRTALAAQSELARVQKAAAQRVAAQSAPAQVSPAQRTAPQLAQASAKTEAAPAKPARPESSWTGGLGSDFSVFINVSNGH